MNYKARKTSSWSVLFVCLSIVAGLLALSGDANAKGSYPTSFTTKYPAAAGSKLESCNLCHGSGGTSTWNLYGQAIKSASGTDIIARITAVEGKDSDGDGFTNLAEINALTFPGDPADKPASGGTTPPPSDTTPPTVSSTNPANNQVGVPVGAAVSATFSEAVAPASVTAASFTLKLGASNVAGTISVNGATATFTPSAPLVNSATYTATLTTAIRDIAGNALAANRTWTFSTAAAADTTPPTVSATSPANNQAGVAVSAVVSATFSEPVAPASVTAASFTVSGVSGTIAVNGATATFTPSAPLGYGTTYTATLTTAIRDVAGNALAANRSWTFTTAAASADTTPPTVTSTAPANNQTGVAVSAVVSATFSEAIAPASVTAASFTVKLGATNAAGTISVNGATATFTPSAPLLNNATYTATITTAVRDVAGNALAANRTWTFTTGAAADTTPPEVSATVPADTQSGVPANVTVSATFSEAVAPASVSAASVTLRDGAGSVPGTVSVSGDTITFSPSVILADDTTYTATITTAITDLAGNALPADYRVTFTTAAASDAATAPPPAADAAGGGGCAIARSGGDIGEIAGAYGFLALAALGMAIRGRLMRKEK